MQGVLGTLWVDVTSFTLDFAYINSRVMKPQRQTAAKAHIHSNRNECLCWTQKGVNKFGVVPNEYDVWVCSWLLCMLCYSSTDYTTYTSIQWSHHFAFVSNKVQYICFVILFTLKLPTSVGLSVREHLAVLIEFHFQSTVIIRFQRFCLVGVNETFSNMFSFHELACSAELIVNEWTIVSCSLCHS